MKLCFKGNYIEMYSTHNEGKYAVGERLSTPLKKCLKYMTLA